MIGSKKSTWVGGTAFIAVVLLAATWFVLVSPALAQAAETRDQAEQAEAFNGLLDQRLKKLKANFAKLDELKQELATDQKEIPPTAGLDTYLEGLDAVAVKHKVTITSLTAGVPEAVKLQPLEKVAKAPAPESSEGSDDKGAKESDPAADAAKKEAEAKLKVPTGFTAIPVSVTVLGSYRDTMAFLDEIQKVAPRLFLVSALQGTSQSESDEGSGKPATKPGDQNLVITGYIFALPDQLTLREPDPNATAAPLPKPGKGVNPLVPVTGD